MNWLRKVSVGREYYARPVEDAINWQRALLTVWLRTEVVGRKMCTIWLRTI
jgi:hypothetical protein